MDHGLGEAKRPTCIIPFYPGGVRSGLLGMEGAMGADIFINDRLLDVLRSLVSEVYL